MNKKARRPRRRAVLLAACLLGFGTLAWDLSRPPESQYSAAAALSVIHVYQQSASPVLSRWGVGCRFMPTCSRYAEVVIRRQGLWVGGRRAAKRLARCGPWTPLGTVDLPD